MFPGRHPGHLVDRVSNVQHAALCKPNASESRNGTRISDDSDDELGGRAYLPRRVSTAHAPRLGVPFLEEACHVHPHRRQSGERLPLLLQQIATAP